MIDEIGSRTYENINYKDTCILSGVNFDLPLNTFNRNKSVLIIRSDLVVYCYGYLAYKFGFSEQSCDVALIWSEDSWKFPNNKVFREKLSQDFDSTRGTLLKFGKNFLKSDAKKINY